MRRVLPVPAIMSRVSKLAMPVMLGMLIQMACNIADMMMVGRLSPAEKAEDAAAALEPALIILWLVGGFFCSIQVGTQALVARRFGEKANDLAGKVLANSFLIATIVGALIAPIGALTIKYVFPIFHKKREVIEYGVQYCQIRFFCILPWVATFSFKAFFDAIGRTHVHLFSAAIMTAVNLATNYVLIFGELGFPKLEVEGAGYGSLMGSFIGLVVMILWSLKRKYREGFQIFKMANFDIRLVKEIARLSWPQGVVTVFLMSGFAFFTFVAGRLDAIDAAKTGVQTAVNGAATACIINALHFCFIPAMGLGTAAGIMVGQSMGARQYNRAELYVWETVKLGALIFGTMGLVAVLFPGWVVGLFNHSESVIRAGEDAMRLIGFFEILVPLALIFPQALFAAGNSKFVMYVEVALHAGCLIGLSAVFGLALEWGLVGIWLTAGMYITGLAVLTGWKFVQGTWKEIRI
ncbi:MAG: MATE family efflux transporter [Deltaproteobacteria bacterium]|nr:MATE family efflux transporter [Deltaproteobacteria bacterium]